MSFFVCRSTLATGLLLLLSIACQEAPTNDYTPPEVRFLSPAYGDTLTPGIFTLSAIATDDVEMSRIVFWRSDSTILGFTEYPNGNTWTLSVDGRTGFSGAVLLFANAVDHADNQSFDSTRVYFLP